VRSKWGLRGEKWPLLHFTNVTESIVYFTKIKERYSLNNVKVLDCAEPRGNGGHTGEHVIGNLEMDNGYLNTNNGCADDALTARSQRDSHAARITWEQRDEAKAIHLPCGFSLTRELMINRTVARQMKAFAFSQTCATASTADLGSL